MENVSLITSFHHASNSNGFFFWDGLKRKLLFKNKSCMKCNPQISSATHFNLHTSFTQPTVKLWSAELNFISFILFSDSNQSIWLPFYHTKLCPIALDYVLLMEKRLRNWISLIFLSLHLPDIKMQLIWTLSQLWVFVYEFFLLATRLNERLRLRSLW